MSAIRALIDMDGVLYDFDGHFLTLWRQLYPDEFYVPLEDRREFYIENQYPSRLKDQILAVYNGPHFCRDLPIIPEAMVGVREMIDAGIEILFCSTPLPDSPTCLQDKKDAIERDFGHEFATRRLILTPDKTVIDADFLLDDKIAIKGLAIPRWTHIVIPAHHNRHLNPPFRWANWRTVLATRKTPRRLTAVQNALK